MDDSKFLITGANGQLGQALQAKYPNAKKADITELDITNAEAVKAYDWSNITHIFNTAAYTNIDKAETSEGKELAYKVNAEAVLNLVEAARKHDLTLVHISTDYVFDGKQQIHTEAEPFNPLNVYGASKAEGDKDAASTPKHYILRTSWVYGNGKNFVRTMLELGKKGISPTVIADQIGRLTSVKELVRAIDFLISTNAPYRTYNVSNSGEPTSWAQITREIYKLAGFDNLTVTDTTTKEYTAKTPGFAPRPLNSTLDLSKIQSLGFKSTYWQDDLKQYVNKELGR